MNNYLKRFSIRISIVFICLVGATNNTVFSAQAAQEQLAFNARVPRVETLALEVPVIEGPVAAHSGAQVPALAQPVVVEGAAQQVSSASTAALEVSSTAMPMPATTDLNSRIKELYSAMQGAQNQVYDAATYAKFGSALVGVFKEAIETQSYMIQLLNAASSTPLLNADQRKYVVQTMIPNLDLIDESTKPLAPASVAKQPSRTQIYDAAHPKGSRNVATPGGKRKRKKHRKANHRGAQASTKAHPSYKKKSADKSLSATAGVAMAKPVSHNNLSNQQKENNPAGGGNSVAAGVPVANSVAAAPAPTSSPAVAAVPVPVVPAVGTATDGDLIV